MPWTEEVVLTDFWTENPAELTTLGWGSAWGGFGWGSAETANIWTEESST